jgi:hypothetical protein
MHTAFQSIETDHAGNLGKTSRLETRCAASQSTKDSLPWDRAQLSAAMTFLLCRLYAPSVGVE